MENKTIKELLKGLKNTQRLYVCAPTIQMKMTGAHQVFIAKNGLLTVIYEDGSKQSKQLGLLENKTEISVFEAVSHVQSKEA